MDMRVPGGALAQAGRPGQAIVLENYMKIIDVPQSGHLGTFISYKTRYGQFRRPYVIPSDPQTPAQLRHRRNMGRPAARWRVLAEIQRASWNAFAEQFHSRNNLGKSGQLTGFNLFVKINSNLADIGDPEVDEPPAFPQFDVNPVGDLIITNSGDIVTLKLIVPVAPSHHILVMGTKPLSAGRSFPGRFIFLGLLPEPRDGMCDITEMYRARFGVPPAQTRIFIRTLEQVNGWKSLPKQTTAIVPPE